MQVKIEASHRGVIYSINPYEADWGPSLRIQFHDDRFGCELIASTENQSHELAKEAIDLMHEDGIVGRRWASKYGGVRNVQFVAKPTLGPGSQLYEITHADGTVFRETAKNLLEYSIQRQEFESTPEGQAEVRRREEESRKLQEAAEARRAADQFWAGILGKTMDLWFDAEGFSLLRRGKAKATLLAKYRYEGLGYMTRLEFVINRLAEGFRVEVEEPSQYNDLKRPVYRLVFGERCWEITKTEYEYALFRMARGLHYGLKWLVDRSWKKKTKNPPKIGWIDYASDSWDRREAKGRAVRLYYRLRGLKLTLGESINERDKDRDRMNAAPL